jgi:hypothetical protein
MMGILKISATRSMTTNLSLFANGISSNNLLVIQSGKTEASW